MWLSQQRSSGGGAVLTLAHRRTQAVLFIGFSPPYQLIRAHAYKRVCFLMCSEQCSMERRQRGSKNVDYCKEMTINNLRS